MYRAGGGASTDTSGVGAEESGSEEQMRTAQVRRLAIDVSVSFRGSLFVLHTLRQRCERLFLFEHDSKGSNAPSCVLSPRPDRPPIVHCVRLEDNTGLVCGKEAIFE